MPSFEVKFFTEDLEDKLRDLGSAWDQIPFEMSLALNNAVTNARRVLVEETWPHSVTQRRSNFPNVALHTTFAKKNSLRVEIADTLNRGHLQLHAVGGTKTPKGANLAIPVADIQRNADGRVRSDQTPKALISGNSKNTVLVTSRGIYTRAKKKGRLVLRYIFKKSANQPADVPFYEDFEATMRTDLQKSLPAAMRRAMSTRR